MLDFSFGGDGRVITAIDPGRTDVANALAIQADGKIVAAGQVFDGSCDNFAVARYDIDGSLDPGFGGDGIVTMDFGTGCEVATSVFVQQGDKILVGGGTHLVRYNPDGTLDTSFDGDGIVVSPVSLNAMALQADGKVVVAGGGSTAFTLARFKATGALDRTFGGDGVVSITVTGIFDTANAVTIQADGKIVAAGEGGGGVTDFAVARLNPDGSPDVGFAGDGSTSTEVTSYNDWIYAVGVGSDGTIVAAGQGGSQAAVARYLPDGSLDPSFDGDGISLFWWTDQVDLSSIHGLSVQSGGVAVIAGSAGAPISDFAIGRMNPDGSLDDTFGAGGVVITDVQGNDDSGLALATQTDGKVVVAGKSKLGSYDFAVTRYVMDPLPGSGLASDLNGDGYGDLVVGVPWENSEHATDSGAINVLPGAASGLGPAGNQFWDEDGTGSSSNAYLDGFGFASATGDFNGDGFADVAASAPGKQVGAAVYGGAVSVLYGSPSGVASVGSQQWTQDSQDVEGVAETNDFFGWSVAAGDLNGDGFDDLAIGVPGEVVAGKEFAGAVNVIYGSSLGLTAAGNQLWNQDSPNINNTAEADDQFGLAVGTGDFDGNGFDDLAVGIPTEDLTNGVDGGAVSVIYGSTAGLTSEADDFWNQDSDFINDKVEKDDWFGYRVASGDFDGDGYGDLIIGVPEENLTGGANAGAVNVMYGTSSGLDAAGDDFWNQDSNGISNTAEANDEFGLAVAAGDFDGDGFADAAIGVPSEDFSVVDGGGVAVIYGTSAGLDDAGDDFWRQDSAGIEDVTETSDLFGYSLGAGQYGNGPEDDLAIGVVLETVGSVQYAGAVNVIYGSPADLTSTGNQFWNQDSTDILDGSEYDDEFGSALAQPGRGGGTMPGVPHVFTPWMAWKD